MAESIIILSLFATFIYDFDSMRVHFYLLSGKQSIAGFALGHQFT